MPLDIAIASPNTTPPAATRSRLRLTTNSAAPEEAEAAPKLVPCDRNRHDKGVAAPNEGLLRAQLPADSELEDLVRIAQQERLDPAQMNAKSSASTANATSGDGTGNRASGWNEVHNMPPISSSRIKPTLSDDFQSGSRVLSAPVATTVGASNQEHQERSSPKPMRSQSWRQPTNKRGEDDEEAQYRQLEEEILRIAGDGNSLGVSASFVKRGILQKHKLWRQRILAVAAFRTEGERRRKLEEEILLAMKMDGQSEHRAKGGSAGSVKGAVAEQSGAATGEASARGRALYERTPSRVRGLFTPEDEDVMELILGGELGC